MANYKRINVKLDSGTAEVPLGMSWYISRVDSGSATYGIQTDENSFDGFVVQVGSTIPGGSTVEGTIEFGAIEYVMSDDISTEDVINIVANPVDPADPVSGDQYELKYAYLFGQFNAYQYSVNGERWDGRGNRLYTAGDWINLQLTDHILQGYGYAVGDTPFSNYRSNPDLPNGLSIDPDTGTIKGIAPQEAFNVSYTITADIDGSDDTVNTKILLIDSESPGVALVYGGGSDYWWYDPQTEYVFQGEEVEVGEENDDFGSGSYFSLVFSKDPIHPVSASLSYDESLLRPVEGIFEPGDTVELSDFSSVNNEFNAFRLLPIANEYGNVTLKSPVSVSLQSDDPGYDDISINTIFNSSYSLNPYIQSSNASDISIHSLSSSNDNLELSLTVVETIPQDIEVEFAIVDGINDGFNNKSQYASVTSNAYFSNSNFVESEPYQYISSECESDSTITVTLTGVEFSSRNLYLVARVSEDQGFPLGDLRDDGYYYRAIRQITASNGIAGPVDNGGVTNASSLSELNIEALRDNDYVSNNSNPYFSTEDASVQGEFYYIIPKNIRNLNFGYEEELYTGEFLDGSEGEWTFDVDMLVDGYSEVFNNITSIGVDEFEAVSNYMSFPGGLVVDFLAKYTVILEDDSKEIRLGPIAYTQGSEFRESDIGVNWIEVDSSLFDSDFMNISASSSDGVSTFSVGGQEISRNHPYKPSTLNAYASSDVRLTNDTSLTEYPSGVNIGYKIRFNDSKGIIKQ